MIILVISMKLEQIIQNVFNKKTFTLEKTDLGLTNRNYLLTVDNKRYMVRCPLIEDIQIVHRHHEKEAMEIIKHTDFDVDTIYYDEATGIKITRYIENAKTFQECNDPYKIERTAKLMKQFHQLNTKIAYDFLPVQRLDQYKSQIKQPLFDLSFADFVIEQVKQMDTSITLCHNDWVDGNILFTDTKTYLIDYEYAGNNDPLFDVMSFLSENNITDPLLRKRFYQTYFDDLNQETLQRLHLWEMFHHILWCNWAMMMYETRKEAIYLQIAKEKYQALQEKVKETIASSK